MAPAYIVNLSTRYIPAQSLWSSDKFLLDVPDKVGTSTYGQRAFSRNSLPENIKNAVTRQ